MAQTREVRGVATSIRTDGAWTHIRYHQTDVVSFTDDVVVLRSGGWETVTTKLRMNQAARQFNLGFTVYAKRRTWYVHFLADESKREFSDGMEIPRIRTTWTGERHIAVS
jgi:hypothetical protein